MKATRGLPWEATLEGAPGRLWEGPGGAALPRTPVYTLPRSLLAPPDQHPTDLLALEEPRTD